MKKANAILLLALWAAITAWGWFGPAKAISETERRPLAQMPELSVQTVLGGRFMEDFEKYSLDQFPLRDSFRTVKSLFHTYVLNQKDNNGIYLHDGFAVKQEYPLRESSVAHAAERFGRIYEKYLSGSKIFLAIVPDKGQYLAEGSGHLTLDYRQMAAQLGEAMPWASQIDLTQVLSAADYYRTDTHWRQENLLPTAGKICEALGVPAPQAADFTQIRLERPFYGVYYGQAALPMAPDEMVLLENDLLKNCTVYDHESGKTGDIYDKTKLDSKDLYEVFLSGPRSLLTIHNPAGEPGRELIVFRDSFGSALVPLLTAPYETVTVVDVRYIQIELLDRFVEFAGQDVLFLYSTLVLNNSSTIK